MVMKATGGPPLLHLVSGAENVEGKIRQIKSWEHAAITTRRLRISEMKREMHRCELTMGKKDPPPTLSSKYRKKCVPRSRLSMHRFMFFKACRIVSLSA